MNRNVLKSILAVFCGLLAVVLLSNGTDIVLEATGVYPPVSEQKVTGFKTPWMAGLALGYRLIYLVVGGYVAAYLAPSKPIQHAVVLGALGTVLGALGALASWEFAPAWFLLAPVILGIPIVWIGAALRVRFITKHNS